MATLPSTGVRRIMTVLRSDQAVVSRCGRKAIIVSVWLNIQHILYIIQPCQSIDMRRPHTIILTLSYGDFMLRGYF